MPTWVKTELGDQREVDIDGIVLGVADGPGNAAYILVMDQPEMMSGPPESSAREAETGEPQELEPDPTPQPESGRVESLAEALDLDTDAPVTDVNGIGEGLAEDIPFEFAHALPASFDGLVSTAGEQVANSVYTYNEELDK